MNKLLSSLLMVSAFSVGLGLAAPQDAAACGGCFHIQQGGDVGQVTGHRMIFSVSQQETTLWDQISYAGAPESFAWVLPIHGQVNIGVSSDALFELVTGMTNTQVYSPQIDCPPCGTTTNTFTGGGGGSGGAGGSDPGVTVIAEETVGPYETVQLSSQDPAALKNWLSGHGYMIPADVQPIINAYVNDGFDFLAIKLVPGQGINSMQPVRVTSPGAGLTLPLRMVAAGTGVTTPITLWVVAEGRYQPTNFPNLVIQSSELTWDWDTMSSDYSVIKQQKFDASQGKGWLLEASVSMFTNEISSPILDAVASQPASAGYGSDPATAQQNAQDDMNALVGNLPSGQFMRLTRIHAELPKSALASDLVLGASADQSDYQPYLFVSKTKGTPPMCPSCGGAGGTTDTTGTGTDTGTDTFTTGFGGAGGSDTGKGASNQASATGGGCSVSGQSSGFAAILALLGLSALLGRRRRS